MQVKVDGRRVRTARFVCARRRPTVYLLGFVAGRVQRLVEKVPKAQTRKLGYEHATHRHGTTVRHRIKCNDEMINYLQINNKHVKRASERVFCSIKPTA